MTETDVCAPERPLHPGEDLIDADDWWACSEPERPADIDCVYEERCLKCIIKAQADLAAGAENESIEDCQTGEPDTLVNMIQMFYARRTGDGDG